MTRPISFHDLPEDAYPVTMRFFRSDTDEMVWEVIVEPYTVVDIPALARQHGVPIYCEIAMANGEVTRSTP
jgi:hypothetical protein